MNPKAKFWQGTRALMVLRALDAMDPQRGYGIASRMSENNGRVKFHRITKSGRKKVASDVNQWLQATELFARFVARMGAKS